MGKIEHNQFEMKVLQVCYKMPFPLKDGGEYSIYNSAKSLLLQPGIKVKVLALNTRKNWVNSNDIPKEFQVATDFEWVSVDTRFNPLKMLLNFLKSESYLVNRFYADSFKEKLLEIVEKEQFDVIQLEHLYLCTYLDDLRKIYRGKIVLRAQNVEYKVWDSYQKNLKRGWLKWYLKRTVPTLKKFEISVINKLDGIITLSDVDSDFYSAQKPIIPIRSIPIGFDTDQLNSYSFMKQFTTKTIVYHLGSMDWRPNIQGVEWFLSEVIPILTSRNSEITVRLAGKKMPEQFYKWQRENLIIDGEVDDAITYIEDKSILIVPLLSGSGIRVKIIEALALGKSIVSTSLGAQGIKYADGENIIIADSAEDFAQAIIQCYENIHLRKELCENGRKLAKNTYGLAEVGEQKISFFKALLSSQKK